MEITPLGWCILFFFWTVFNVVWATVAGGFVYGAAYLFYQGCKVVAVALGDRAFPPYVK